jgi:hypothetical protein
MTPLDVNTARKPSPTGVKYPLPSTLSFGITGVGKSVAVDVAVKDSAPIWVTVGVKVSGVLVDVAKRFCVGAGVSVGSVVGVSVKGGGVGVKIRLVISASDAQLESKMVNTTT